MPNANDMKSKLDDFFEINKKWKNELFDIRTLLNETELTESYKWQMPVYTINDKNVLSIGAFKNHFGIWFFNGVFLKEEQKILIAKESTKAMRQIRYDKNTKIDFPTLKKYVLEAIDNQKNGLEVKVTRKSTFILAEILENALKNNKELSALFQSLSFGKRKEYSAYISDAKQEKTKLSRLSKITPMIIEGIGLNDKYRKK